MAWIRSQDKDLIIRIEESLETRIMEPMWAIQVDSQWIIGMFQSYEAALEELDRIEKWIADGAQGVYQVSGV